MKLSDFKGLFKKSYMEVISVENPHSDYYLVKLKPSKDLKWEAGEHASFSLPNRKVEDKKWRAFSIASVDSEGYVLLGTRTGKEVSSFKKNLIDMKAGEKVGVRGPFGWFKIADKKSHVVMIASGVGVTPIRALAKQLENDTSRDIHVVFTSSDYYLFGEELEAMATSNPLIKLYKTKGREATQKQIKELAEQYSNDAYYYISGSMPVIKSTKELLKTQGIKANRVLNDPFLGY